MYVGAQIHLKLTFTETRWQISKFYDKHRYIGIEILLENLFNLS